MNELLSRLQERLLIGRKTVIAFSNPEFVIEARQNDALRGYLNDCDYNLADGHGVLWAARVLGEPNIPERITGTDFLPKLCGLCAEGDLSLFFFGGKPGIAEEAAENMRRKYEGLKIVGVQNGFVMENDRIVEQINLSRADVLMVCLGNPLQEEWIRRYAPLVEAKLIFGNGGALDFHSGRVKRAPNLLIKMHLEWLFRLGQDPSWKRVRRQLSLISFVVSIRKEKHDRKSILR